MQAFVNTRYSTQATTVGIFRCPLPLLNMPSRPAADDQDTRLSGFNDTYDTFGSLEAMPVTKAHFIDGGAHFANSFVVSFFVFNKPVVVLLLLLVD
jgi:hypothetical protein